MEAKQIVEKLRTKAVLESATNEMDSRDHLDWIAADLIESLEARVRELEGFAEMFMAWHNNDGHTSFKYDEMVGRCEEVLPPNAPKRIDQ